MDIVKNRNLKASSGGFTLIEASMIVVVASLLLSAGLGLLQSWTNQSLISINQLRINAVQQALINFEKQNGRYPCPASFAASVGTNSFGREFTTGATPITCKVAGGSTYTTTAGRIGPSLPPGTVTPMINTDGTIFFGAVPVRDLGLPDSYAGNAYGYMFSYAVSKSAVNAPLNPFAGVIDVQDSAGASVLPPPASGPPGTAEYVVVDHGKDGKGAHINGGSLVACAALGTTKDSYNCSYEAAYKPFRSAPFNDDAKLVPGSWFDDTIRYNNPTSSVCKTYSSDIPITGGPAVAGTSTGYTMGGQDSSIGWGTGIGAVFFAYVFYFTVSFQYGIDDTQHSYIHTSPTADAYCPLNYNVMAGGCTQSLTAGGQPFGGDVNAGNSDQQLIMPPLSHPTYNTTTGLQGWECNGSSSKGMYTEAFVTCCP